MKRNRLLVTTIVLVLVVACLAAFVACGDNNNDKKPEASLRKITFLLDWAPNTNHTGLYVAKKLGYFEEAGLDVDIIQPGNTGTSASVATGTAEFGIDFQEQMIFNEMQNVGVTAVGAIIQHNTSGILSEKKSGITRPKDMEGKKYATWGMPGEQAIVKAMMKNDGADPNTLTMDPKYVENILAEFASPNGVNCVWSYAAWDKIIAEKNGLDSNFIWMRDYDRLDYYTPVIIANNEFIKKNPETVKAFMNAVSKGYNYAIANPKAAADILIELNPEIEQTANKDVIYASQEFLAKEYKSDAPYWGHIDATRWDGFFNLMCEISGEGFPTDITDGYGFTNEYLPEYKAA